MSLISYKKHSEQVNGALHGRCKRHVSIRGHVAI
jgi:hypothetical protein